MPACRCSSSTTSGARACATSRPPTCAVINLGHPADELRTRFEPAADRMRVHPRLEPAPGDVVIPKDRGSAFKGTDFDLLLRTLQRETVVVTGCSTDWCVEATAWDGNGLDYYLVMVSDCLRSPRPDGHRAALRQFRAIGLDLTTSADLLHLWEHAAPAP
ncbi:MAG: cysteine hydrolase [Spirochaetaceae bacterium]|nr:cysteine hydrolase [Spirochaetaceae bacterium]